MRKKWVGSIFVILLILAILPAIFGLLAKRTLEQVIADLPLPEGVSLTLQDYTFGWLNSYVAIKIHVVKNEQQYYIADNSLDIITHGHITHGPLFMTEQGLQLGLARVDTHATLKDIKGLNKSIEAGLAHLFKDNDLLRASSVFYFNRKIDINLKSSPIHTQADGDTLQWNGINGLIKINHDFTQLHTEFMVSPVLFTTKEGAVFDAAQMQYTAQLHRAEQQPWVGEQLLTIPTFYLKDETGAVLRFDHLKIMSHSNIIKDLLQASLDIEANNIEMNGQHIDDMHFDLTLANFAKEPLLKLSQLMQQAPIKGIQNQQVLLQQIMQALITGADIELDYLLNMQKNQILLHIVLNFPDIKDKENASAAEKIQLLLKDLIAQVSFVAPQETVKELLFSLTESAAMPQGSSALSETQTNQIKQKIDAQIMSLVQNGVLVEEGNYYHFEFDYKQGNMMLNSKPLTAQEVFLLSLLLSEAISNESTAY